MAKKRTGGQQSTSDSVPSALVEDVLKRKKRKGSSAGSISDVGAEATGRPANIHAHANDVGKAVSKPRKPSKRYPRQTDDPEWVFIKAPPKENMYDASPRYKERLFDWLTRHGHIESAASFPAGAKAKGRRKRV